MHGFTTWYEVCKIKFKEIKILFFSICLVHYCFTMLCIIMKYSTFSLSVLIKIDDHLMA